jgi:hypothetical protein
MVILVTNVTMVTTVTIATTGTMIILVINNLKVRHPAVLSK